MATQVITSATKLSLMKYTPFEIYKNSVKGPWVIICDHASNYVPKSVADGKLGINESEMKRHIAFDIGAKGLALKLGKNLDAPVVCSNFSRLVIDPNRGEKDPTLVMQLYDGTIIPANQAINNLEIERRLDLFYRPYHNAITHLLDRFENPIIISIHYFTPKLKGKKIRPWHIGLLAADDRRFHNALLKSFESEPQLCIGDNKPYIGKLPGDTIDKHAIKNQRLNTLIEIRNDLIKTAAEQKAWAEIITKNLIQAKEYLNG